MITSCFVWGLAYDRCSQPKTNQIQGTWHLTPDVYVCFNFVFLRTSILRGRQLTQSSSWQAWCDYVISSGTTPAAVGTQVSDRLYSVEQTQMKTRHARRVIQQYVQGGFTGGLDGRPSPARVMPTNVSSAVAKGGDQTKCQQLRVPCTLGRRMRDCCRRTDMYDVFRFIPDTDMIFGHSVSDTHIAWLKQGLGRGSRDGAQNASAAV